MFCNTFYIAAALSVVVAPVIAQTAHGEGEQGSSMGPVAFLWPSDRPWSASQDNIAPCGTSSGVGNRTEFPTVGGAVALSIADDAWNVAFSISYQNNPSSQSDFEQLIPSKVAEVEAGHQCYRVPTIESNVAEGTNATIQMEYWSNDSGRDESFFACADITIVGAQSFDTTIPCFNVTTSEFEAPATTTTITPEVPQETQQPEQVMVDNGLTNGQKAGIAVGSILGAALIVGVAVFFAFRKRSKPADSEASPYTSEAKGAPSAESVARQ